MVVLYIAGVILAVGITIYIMGKLSGAQVTKWKLEAQDLQERVDQLAENNKRLRERVTNRELKIKKAQLKIEKINDTSAPDNINDLSDMLNAEFND